jgi:hypothetical protein
MTHQQSRLKRFWARSSHPAQQQYPCDTPLASTHPESLLVDSPTECKALAKAEVMESFHDPNLQKSEPWMETLSSFMDCQLHSDSSTVPTSFRSAFEMLSFSSLCGAEDEPVSWSDADELSPSRAMQEASTGLVGLAGLAGLTGIPSEISVKQQDSLDARQSKFPEELADLKVRDKRSSFLKLLRKRNSKGKSSRTSNSVAKLYLYVEQPKPLVHTNSIANSTITWSSEHRARAL